MKKLGLLLGLLLVVGLVSVVLANDNHHGRHLEVEAKLSGFQEVHFNAGSVVPTVVPPSLLGAISTPARGTFEATIDKDGQIIHYELSYEGLVGTVSQAHIHFGQKHTVGGIVVWLCQGTVRAPASVAAVTPECPGPNAGTVTGTIVPAQVLAQTPQGFAAGDFDELVRAIKAGAAYANVHSTVFGPGEIRGQIHDEHDKHDRHHHHGRNGHR